MAAFVEDAPAEDAPADEPIRQEIVPGPNVTEIRVTVTEDQSPARRGRRVGLLVAVAGGLACLIAALVPVGPDLLAGVGATAS